jgi:hypothetical protein
MFDFLKDNKASEEKEETKKVAKVKNCEKCNEKCCADAKKKTAVKPAKKVLKDDITSIKKDFDSIKEVDNYYKAEKEKIKSVIDALDRERAQSYINIAKNNVVKLRIKKQRLDMLHDDLTNHIGNVEKKIKQLADKKLNKEKSIEDSKTLKQSLIALDEEEKRIIETRKELASKEKQLLSDIKKVSDQIGQDSYMKDSEFAKKILANETSKEMVLENTEHLLSEESTLLLNDQTIIDSLSKDAVKEIASLNAEIERLQKKKRALLEKKQLLEISEKDAQIEIDEMDGRKAELEKKYKKYIG